MEGISELILKTMAAVVDARIVLMVFIIWVLVLGRVTVRAKSTRWLRWLLLLPLVLFLRRNPFGSVMSASIFLVWVWALDMMFALSFPLLWWLGQLGVATGLLSILLLMVPSILKGAAPGESRVGIVLACLFGPWGHWYLEGGGIWVVGVWASAFLAGLVCQLVWISWPGVAVSDSLDLPKLWLGWPGAIFHLASGLLMYYRFKNWRSESPKAETL